MKELAQLPGASDVRLMRRRLYDEEVELEAINHAMGMLLVHENPIKQLDEE